MNSAPHPSPADIIDLNVGGVLYTTTRATLTHDPSSRLARMFGPPGHAAPTAHAAPPGHTTPPGHAAPPTHAAPPEHRGPEPLVFHGGRAFIDRDGALFRYVLDFLRDGRLTLPEGFNERARLRQEADYFELSELVQTVAGHRPSIRSVVSINGISPTLSYRGGGGGNGGGGGEGYGEPACLTVGYRGTFAFGRGDGAGASDVKFRKLLRILVAGRVSVCKEVFQDSLNESRDPDRGDSDRYTARFFLKHAFLEQAFDRLHEAHFRMVGATASGTNSAASGDAKAAGADVEETRWLHYNEYVFKRP